MEATISIITTNDINVVKNAVEKANKTHEWNIKLKFKTFTAGTEIYMNVEITTESTEQILYLGIYMGRLGF